MSKRKEQTMNPLILEANLHGSPDPTAASPGGGRIDVDELSDRALRGEIETVLCVMPDLWGRAVGKRVTPQTFLKTALGREGLHASMYLFVVDMEMEPRPGYALTSWDDGFQDCRMVPDLDTLRVIPWLERTALVICDPYSEEANEPIEVAPRNILKRQLARLAERDMAMQCATELEFFLFADTPRAAWEQRYRSLNPLSYYRADYHILQSTKNESLLGRLRSVMDAADIEIEFSKAEWGLGQQEVNLRYAAALEMADRHLLYKNGVKEIMALAGHAVTFMAKPFIDEVGSSCHVHSSLWTPDLTAPLFETEGDSPLGPLLSSFLAGQAAYGRELALMFAPTINSYKRFQPNQFAGNNFAWGIDNRTCGLRLVGEGPSLRLEHRVAGADANPYIAIAAIAAAGLAGIEDQLAPPPHIQTNATSCPPELRVPTSFSEALELFESSRMLPRALGQEVFGHLRNFYRQELLAFEHETVTDWELMRYFERV
jgi:glutamine synthetase